jgi:hypothetical protein
MQRLRTFWTVVIGLILALWLCVLLAIASYHALRWLDVSLPSGSTATPAAALPPTRALPQATSMPSPTAPPSAALPTVAPPAVSPTAPTSTPRPATATPTRMPSPPVVPSPTPTPIVCDDIEQIGEMSIAPGQSFRCTVRQEQLSAQIARQPNVPCSEIEVTLDDGQIAVSCRMGLRLSATGVVETKDCRASIRVTRATMGFTQIVQELLDENMQLVPYDLICVEQVEIDDGQMTIAGHARGP